MFFQTPKEYLFNDFAFGHITQHAVYECLRYHASFHFADRLQVDEVQCKDVR